MAAVTLTWWELAFPAGFDADHVMVFTRLLATRPLRGLFRQPDPLVCEVVATADGVSWRLGMTGREAAALLPPLRGQLPAVTVTERDGRGLILPDAALELRLTSGTYPLRTDAPEAVTAAVLAALAGVQEGETLVLSWLVGPSLDRPAVAAGDSIDAFGLGPELDTHQAAALRDKLAEPLYAAVARIGVTTTSPTRRTQLTERVLGALVIAAAPGVGFAARNVAPRRAAKRLARLSGPLFGWPVHVNASELAAVLGWPIGNPYVPNVTYRGSRQLPPQPAHWVPAASVGAAAPGAYRIIGRSTFPTATAGYVHLPATDARYHTHVIGPTGSGKSVLLAHLIEADIAAARSVLVIDPKSDLVAAVADRIPPDRADDVVWIDPTDPDHAVGFDVLAGDPELAADRFAHIMGDLFAAAWGPKTAQVLYNAAVTLARCGQPLVELPRLFTDPGYRGTLIEQAADPLGVGSFWDWFHTQSDREQTSAVAPALSRLDTLLGRRLLRGVIGQPSPRFTLGDLFTRPRIVLVSLARGQVGPEAARLLGGLLLSQFWQNVMAQTAVPEDQRTQVSAVVDEFQDYAAGVADFGEALAQSRGLGVAWTLAHQGMHQLDTQTAAAVLVNARSRIVFQHTAPTEARELAASLGGDLTPQDVAALDAHHVYASLASRGATLPPVSAATLPPRPPLGTVGAVRDRSRGHYGTPRADIDAAILAHRHPTTAPQLATVGRRPRGTSGPQNPQGRP